MLAPILVAQNGNPGSGEILFLDRRFSMWAVTLLGICVVSITLLGVYIPTVYIRKTNKVLKLLDEIAANTSK
jgi:hypothetical protein